MTPLRDRKLTLVLGIGLATRIALMLSARGTDDVLAFRLFAEQISKLGPYRIYRTVTALPYNHAPITGWMLRGLWFGAHHGLPFAIGLRSLSIIADTGSALLAYLIVSNRFGQRRGLLASALVALNPVAIFISGFHGNVDPVALFFALAAFYLIDRDKPLLSGVAFAVALGVKIVPVVTLPLLFVMVFQRRDVKPFLIGFVSVSALVWVPALVVARTAAVTDVFGYSGGKGHLLPMIAFIIAALAGVAMYRVSGNPFAAGTVALLGLFALSPAWAAQYVVWPIAFGATAAFEVPATIYALAGGGFLFEWYSHWWGHFPWHHPFTTQQGPDLTAAHLFIVMRVAAVGWLVLLGLREPPPLNGKATTPRNPVRGETFKESGLR